MDNEYKDITVFVDESGTIPKETMKEKDFFIITLLFVEDKNIEYVKKLFRRYRLQVIRKKESLFNTLKLKGEIKGSEVSEASKNIIYSKIMKKCNDKFELAIIVLNNAKATEKFKSNSSRAFNFLIKNYLCTYFKKYSRYKKLNSIKFIIDERNVATESKYTLKEYLNTELNLVEHLSKEDIDVHYFDSKKYLLLQMTDFISNTFYRKLQKNIDDKGNVQILLDATCKKNIFKFPNEK